MKTLLILSFVGLIGCGSDALTYEQIVAQYNLCKNKTDNALDLRGVVVHKLGDGFLVPLHEIDSDYKNISKTSLVGGCEIVVDGSFEYPGSSRGLGQCRWTIKSGEIDYNECPL